MIALSQWVLAIPFALLQWYINRDRWFLQIQAPEGRRSWKHWFCPFLLRSSRSVPPSSPAEAEKTNNDAFGRDIDDAASKPAGSLHSRQNSTPDTTISIDADLAERGSLASGSDLRALTSNYRRALEILESEDGHQTEDMRETVAVPIQYRPAPLHLENPISSTSKNAQQTSLHQPSSPTRPIMQRSGLNSPVAAYRNAFGRQEQGTDQVPDLGGFRRRADSDRGTSYSIPLTNITSSEYKDRDMFRPPSWTGDLP